MFKFAATLILVVASTEAYSFTLQNQAFTHFPVDEVTVNIADTSCSNINITPAILKDYVEKGINRFWNTVPSSRLKLRVGTIKTGLNITNVTTLDQVIALAETNSIIVSCSPNNTIFTNPYIHAFANIRASNPNKAAVLINNVGAPTFGLKEQDEQIAIIAHEIGHAIGIGHSEDDTALMYYSASGKTQTLLTKDDVDAVTYLYPNRPPVSCGSIEDVSKKTPGSFLFQMVIGFLAIATMLKIKGRSKGATGATP